MVDFCGEQAEISLEDFEKTVLACTVTSQVSATKVEPAPSVVSVGPVMTEIQTGTCPICGAVDVPLEFDVGYTDKTIDTVCVACGGQIYEEQQRSKQS